jgi:uncharacterized protein YprB with RNaseH-like and TPR domain
MLRSTFQHLPGIGPITEAALWREAIYTWDEFRARASSVGLTPERHDRLLRELDAGERELDRGGAEYFGRRLPPREHWRIYPSFARATAFLDIETTGLSPHEGIVTVVTIHGGGQTRSFVADQDLEEVPAYLRRFPILVTFNGSLFDVPFLQARFPQLIPPGVHIDLRFVLYRLGLSGGLKRIEQQLGVGGRTGVEGIHGLDAVRLWEEYRRGRTESLERLVRYNRADTVNLEPILQWAVRMLRTRLGVPDLGPSTAAGARPRQVRQRSLV